MKRLLALLAACILLGSFSIVIAEDSQFDAPYIQKQWDADLGEWVWYFDGSLVFIDDLMIDMIHSMSDYGIIRLYEAIKDELSIRGDTTKNNATILVAKKDTVILDKNGVQIYIDSFPTITYNWDNECYLNIPMVIVNNTRMNICVVPQEASINGWKAECHFTDGNVPMRKKAKVKLKFLLDYTDVDSLEEFEEFELWFKVFDNDNWYGPNVIERSRRITVYASY